MVILGRRGFDVKYAGYLSLKQAEFSKLFYQYSKDFEDVFFVYLRIQLITMTQLMIDNKKYVLIPEKEYTLLQKKAALKVKSEKLFSLDEARQHSKKLVKKWASGK